MSSGSSRTPLGGPLVDLNRGDGGLVHQLVVVQHPFEPVMIWVASERERFTSMQAFRAEELWEAEAKDAGQSHPRFRARDITERPSPATRIACADAFARLWIAGHSALRLPGGSGVAKVKHPRNIPHSHNGGPT
ncbi:MAG TPA: hypothetical protein VGB15_20695 [Longimicrobium sp.]|jgi:hypothetical protein